jgi:hypothetical protein
MDSSVALKDEIWFLRICHHISNVLYTAVGVLQQADTLNVCHISVV